jgi:hypothetical protein
MLTTLVAIPAIYGLAAGKAERGREGLASMYEQPA